MPDATDQGGSWPPTAGLPHDLVDAVLGMAWLFAAGRRSSHTFLSSERGPREIWQASERRLRSWGAPRGWARDFAAVRREVPLQELRRSLERSGLNVIPCGCPGYPSELLRLQQPPSGLFLAGGAEALAEALARPRVAIVGCRNPDSYGLACASAFAAAFARADVTVVSGMALGIDGQAHVAALKAGGLSLAVLGSGADSPYPRRHRSLYQLLTRSAGVLSELPPGAAPARWSFPWRNRLLAALGDALLVVQAGAKSGAFSTVDHALEIQRDVYVVPGRVRNSRHAGSNRLLYEGAFPAIDPDTLVQDFFANTRIARVKQALLANTVGLSPPSDVSSLGSVQRLVLLALGSSEGSIEALASVTGCGISEVAAACAVLEVEGRCTRAETGVYRLAS